MISSLLYHDLKDLINLLQFSNVKIHVYDLLYDLCYSCPKSMWDEINDQEHNAHSSNQSNIQPVLFSVMLKHDTLYSVHRAWL